MPPLTTVIESRFKRITLEVNVKNVVMNTIAKGSKGHNAANLMCLLTKQYIYRQKCLGLEINLYQLKCIFRQVECLEKYIAIKNSRLQVHTAKWQLQLTENLANCLNSG